MTRNLSFLAAAIAMLVLAPASQAIVISYTSGPMSGALESPPNGSLGTGVALVDYDNVLHTLHINANFSGLTGNTTIAHIHAPTAIAFAGTAGVATTQPSFPGWPAGVTSGSYNMTIDLTQASAYNATFMAAQGGTPASAEAALANFMASGTSYFNIHSSAFGGGEIRGFLVPVPEPGSFMLVGGAMAVGAWVRRRRNTK